MKAFPNSFFVGWVRGVVRGVGSWCVFRGLRFVVWVRGVCFVVCALWCGCVVWGPLSVSFAATSPHCAAAGKGNVFIVLKYLEPREACGRRTSSLGIPG